MEKVIMTVLVTCSTIFALGPYTDNGNGTVTDQSNNLVWQKCSMGLNNDTTCSGSATTATFLNALTYCQGLALAGRTWRLPNVNEIGNLLDYTVSVTPLINTTLFPGTIALAYASSTTDTSTPANAWGVAFGTGTIYSITKVTGNYVRCVASGP